MILKNIALALLMVLVFGAGFMFGRSGIETPVNSAMDAVSNVIETKVQGTDVAKPTTEDGQDSTQETEKTSGGLSDSQRKMLESFGINPDTATLTPEAIACAEAKIGKERVAEIMNGSTPSLLEGASLVACYK